MFESKIISFEELSRFGPVENLNQQAIALVKQQLETWELARKNYEALSLVQTKTFDFGHFKIVAQHNPKRIRSSAAKVDAKSIADRPCFLCAKNLPESQKVIVFQHKFLILTNPFPVFPVHLTISRLEHTPQRILGFFPDMLELSCELHEFTVFYNGPQCGASAPDHFHFQAGKRGFLPVEHELNKLEKHHSKMLFHKSKLQVYAVENYLRRFIAIISSDKNEIIRAFSFMLEKLPSVENNEPLVNILCWFGQNKWNVLLFPRAKQRPSRYFQTGKKQVVVSPASVELGGIFVLPRVEDFGLVQPLTIQEIYEEVTLDASDFEHLSGSFSEFC